MMQYEIAIDPASGTFEVTGVEPATYRILFTAESFDEETAEDTGHLPQLATVEIQPGKTARVDVRVP